MPACFIAILLLGAALCAGCTGNSSPRSGNDNEKNDGTLQGALKPQLAIHADDDDPAQIVIAARIAGSTDWFPADRVDDTAFCRRVLALYIENVDALEDGSPVPADGIPILGKYRWEQGSLQFRPAYSLDRGERYAVRFEPAAASDKLAEIKSRVDTYTVPAKPQAPPPNITAIYPSGDVVPANHLKFYLVFSRPMQQGDIFGHFRLIDDSESRQVGEPFRLTELWSQDGRRLTLWFHPGRQKDGVNLNVELGPILNPGRDYRLIVSGQWTSADGVPLGDDLTKRFRAGPVDRRQPLPGVWDMAIPAAGSREPLVCQFGEPLDWALLNSEIHVEDATGQPIAGELQIGAGEKSWSWVPAAPWQSGSYRLAVGRVLEDLAGNSIERPFEVDLNEKPVEQVGRVVYREFEIESPSSAIPP